MLGPKIILHPNALLAVPCSPVAVFDKELKSVANQMVWAMRKGRGIGLAAPQIGQLKAIIVVDTSGVDYGPASFKGTMVNPQIVKASKEIFKYIEGCLSLPGQKFWTARADEITVRWQTLNGEEREQSFRGITAVCIQHEIEHLSGITLAESAMAAKI